MQGGTYGGRFQICQHAFTERRPGAVLVGHVDLFVLPDHTNFRIGSQRIDFIAQLGGNVLLFEAEQRLPLAFGDFVSVFSNLEESQFLGVVAIIRAEGSPEAARLLLDTLES